MEKSCKKIQQAGNFAPRTLPVFTAESEERKKADTALGAGLYDAFRGLGSSLVTRQATATLLFQPVRITPT